VVVPEHTDDEAMLLMLAENMGRATVAPDDLARTIRTLTSAEFSYSIGALAERLGVTEQTIRDWRAGHAAPHLTPVPRAGRRRAASTTPRPWTPRFRPRDVHDLLRRLDAAEIDEKAGAVS